MISMGNSEFALMTFGTFAQEESANRMIDFLL